MNTSFFARLRDFLGRHWRLFTALLVFSALAPALWDLYTQRHPSPKPSTTIQSIIDRLEQETPPAPVPPKAEEPVPPPVASLPQVAIVIDDVGLTETETNRAIALPAGVTLSIFPYAPRAQAKADAARKAGHEVFMHVPMQPLGSDDPGPGALRVDMDDDALRETIEKDLSSFTGYVGVNNHMGSRFTADEHGMQIFLEAVKARGLIFLDSRTNVETKAEDVAHAMGVPATRRNIFLDNALTEESIADQFSALLTHARQHGRAVAIIHPHPISLDILTRLLPYLHGRYELVPVSAMVSQK